MRYLLSADPSLTCTGWALFRVRDEALLAVGKLKSLPADRFLSERLSDIQFRVNQLMNSFDLKTNDVLICEGETTMLDPRAAIKVEQVRGIIEAVARQRGVDVPGRLNPRSVQSELMGLRGKQPRREVVKRVAREIAISFYRSTLVQLGLVPSHQNLIRHQDVVDAILIGRLGLVRIQSAERAKLPVSHILGGSTRKRRRTRLGWGHGESNSFGWTTGELAKLQNEKG